MSSTAWLVVLDTILQVALVVVIGWVIVTTVGKV